MLGGGCDDRSRAWSMTTCSPDKNKKKIPTFRRAVFKSKICPISEMTVLFMKKFRPSSVVECVFKRTHSNHSLSVTLTHIHSSSLCLWYLRTADLHGQRPPLSFLYIFFTRQNGLWGCIFIFLKYFFFPFSFRNLWDLCPTAMSGRVHVCMCRLVCHCRAIYNNDFP